MSEPVKVHMTGITFRCPVCPPEAKELHQPVEPWEVSLEKTRAVRLRCPRCGTALEVR